MADITYSAIANGAVLGFDPATDRLLFDDPALGAAALELTFTPGVSGVLVTTAAKSFTLATLAEALAATSFVFADGSLLLIGDATTGTAADPLANRLIGAAGADQLLGLAGADTLGGGAGADRLDGGTGGDLLRGGLGSDTYVVDDVFDMVDETPTPDTLRASVGAGGVEGDGASQEGIVSADGRYVAFHSAAANLFGGGGSDLNGAVDVFLKDMVSGLVQRVSTNAAGLEAAGGDSFVNAISPDGRYLVLASAAGNLVAADGNLVQDVFVKDMLSGAIQRVSVSASGAEGNGASGAGRIAADGRWLVFESQANNLVAGDTNGVADIHVKDLLTGAVLRANTDAIGNQANAAATRAQVSADGRWVLFDSAATNLVAGDTSTRDVFVKDLLTGAIAKLSQNAAGVGGNAESSRGQFSADGRSVVFQSSASNLSVSDLNGAADVFVRNLATGEIRLVSTDADGAQVGEDCVNPGISGDGRYVVFDTTAGLDAGDSNGVRDVYVKDLVTGAVARVSTDAAGGQAIGGGVSSDLAAISADGRWITYRSSATDLVAGDGNGATDTFRVRNPLLDDGAVDTVRASLDFTLPSGVEHLVLVDAAGAASGSGNALANRITGNASANLLGGAAGHDTLDGGAGLDTLGNGLANRITGNAAANTLEGAEGADTLDGGAGLDTLAGGTGNDVYLVDAGGDTVTEFDGPDPVRASTGAGGQAPAAYSVDRVQLSADGRQVLFVTGSANLVVGDTNFAADAFVKDLATGALQRASTGAAGQELAGSVGGVAMSADARHLAFVHGGALVAGDTNGLADIYVKDLATGALQRVTLTADGRQGTTGQPVLEAISADGQRIAFRTADPAFLGGATGSAQRLVVKDLATGELTVASTDLDGETIADEVFNAWFTGDATQLVFTTAAAIDPGDTNGTADAYLRDLATGQVVWVSANAAGAAADSPITAAGISADGRWVALAGNATNLVAGTNGTAQVYLKDLSDGSVRLVSANAAGTPGDAASLGDVAVSADGRYVAFESYATNLVPGAAMGGVYIKDMLTGQVRLVSTGPEGQQLGAGIGEVGNFSADATRLVITASTDLLPGGGSGTHEAYVVLNPFLVRGGGVDTVRASASFTLPANVEHLVLTGSAAIDGTGNALANTLTGNRAANLLDGGAGADTMDGGAGDDSYRVDQSGDRVVERVASGDDRVLALLSYTLPVHVERLTLGGSGAIDGSGNTLANTLTGNAAANRLDGGAGADTMTGGAGNDTYLVDQAGDVTTETGTLASEVDTVLSAVTRTLGANLENLTLTGSAAIAGTGNTLKNVITGNGAANLLNGGGGHDALAGGAGNDTLNGSTGNDTLAGGGGADVFAFTTALGATTNVERISDFNVVSDRIQLENAVFTRLSTTGVLSAANFRASATGNAADANDYVVYNTATGQLFYDADGSGAGAKLLVATLANLPALTAADLFVT